MDKQILQQLTDNNLFFSDLEKTYLIYNVELRKKVIDEFKKRRKTLKKEFFDFVSFFISRDIDILGDDEELKLQYSKCVLTFAYDGPSTMVECLGSISNSAHIKELKEVYDGIKDKFDIANAIVFDVANLATLIKEKKFDAINFESIISPENMDDYVNMVVANIKDVHPIMIVYITRKTLDANAILFESEFVNKMRMVFSEGAPKDFLNLINEDSNDILGKFRFFVNKLDYSARFDIYDLLYASGIYLFANEMVGFNLISDEDLREKLIKDMKENDYSFRSFIKYYPKEKLDNLYNDEFVDALIETGNIEHLLRSGKYSSMCVDRIREHIESSDKAYIDKINRKEICCEEGDASIIEAVLRNPNAKVVHLFDGDILNNRILELLKKSLEVDPSREIVITSDTFSLKVFEIFVSTNSVENIKAYFKQYLKKFANQTKTIVTNSFRTIRKNDPDFYEELFLEYFNDEDVSSSYNKSVLRSLFLENKKFRELIFIREYLKNNALFVNVLEDDELVYYLDFIVKQKKLNKHNVEALKAIAGKELLYYIDDKNILELLSLNESLFDKLMALFPNKRYTMDDLDAAYDNIKQHEFSIKFAPIVDSFATLLNQIQSGHVDKELVSDVANNLNGVFFEMLEKDLGAKIEPKYKSNPRKFLELVIYKINNGDPEKYSKILKYIMDYYVDKKRDEYKKTYNVKGDIKLIESIDENSAKQVIFNYFLEKDVTLPDETSFVNVLIGKCHEKGYSDELIQDLINFNKNKHVKLSNKAEDVASKMFEFRLLGLEIITKVKNESPAWYEDLRKKILTEKDKELKKNYSPGKTSLSVCKILSYLRIDVLKGILDNEYYYQKLKEVMSKRKLHKLPSELIQFVNNNNYLDFEINERQIAAFMSYFMPILRKEEEDRKKKKHVRGGVITLSSIFKKTKGYSRTSDIYSQILTPKDAKLIDENPGAMSANRKTQGDQRLRESVEWTLKAFERQRVTVPTFNRVYKIGPVKIRAIVGNFTNPCNFSHGERVDSCMRIGGVGEQLYEFCMKNDNGFHIRYEDATTGKYLGKESCFRHGNSVFKSELSIVSEEAINAQYIINASCENSKDLIAESSVSDYPIENVFISARNGFENEPKANLGVESIHEGWDYFYSSISKDNAVVQATTATDKPFVPVNFSEDNMPYYPPGRDEVKCLTNTDDMLNVINRIYAVKLALDGMPFEYISSNASGYLISLVNNIENVIYFVCNNDWYYCVCSDGRTYQDFIDKDKRALKELLEYENAYKKGNFIR